MVGGESGSPRSPHSLRCYLPYTIYPVADFSRFASVLQNRLMKFYDVSEPAIELLPSLVAVHATEPAGKYDFCNRTGGQKT